MLPRILLFSALVMFLAFCTTKKKADSTRPLNIPEGKTAGTISHKYDNCGAVVLVKEGETELVLIPFPALDKKYDAEGMTIIFNYRKLRMPHPSVCQTGLMAELTNITTRN